MTSKQRFILWLAQGFGIGRIPFAPGTFGSILGLVFFARLLWADSVWALAGGILAGVAASIWLCDQGERILNQKDPGSVVMDEVIAIPICFLGWLQMRHAPLPSPASLFTEHWLAVIVIFALFRLFDITKPWPIGRSQNLPGGWGVTVDDVLAAVYVNGVVVAAMAVL